MRAGIGILVAAFAWLNSSGVLSVTSNNNFIADNTYSIATVLLQASKEEQKDTVYSPLGYSVLLAILAEGARGETRKQLEEFLHLPEDTRLVRDSYKTILESMKDNSTINKPQFRNWFHVYKTYPVNKTFKKVIFENYLTKVVQTHLVNHSYQLVVDEEEVEKNNDEQVKLGADEGKLEKTVDEGKRIEYEPNMNVFNGLSFRGVWDTPFSLVEAEEEKHFYISSNEKTKVPMMQRVGKFNVGSISELNASAVEIPFYTGGEYSMTVLLPNERDGLHQLIDSLPNFSLGNINKYLSAREVNLVLPKLQIQNIYFAETAFRKAGVTNLFTEFADLTGIGPDKLKMGGLGQRVNLQVDQDSSKGTLFQSVDGKVTEVYPPEGRAEATLSLQDSLKGQGLQQFVVDHPFLFFIRNQTNNVIIVAGKVVDTVFHPNPLYP